MLQRLLRRVYIAVVKLVVAEAKDVAVLGGGQDVFPDTGLRRFAGLGGGDEFHRRVIEPLAQFRLGLLERLEEFVAVH
ncbi:hypothetical protein D3C75_969590 [compost metagenome]